MTLNLDNDGVELIEITVGQARAWFDGDHETPLKALDTALDEAQAHAFGGNGDAYVVIKIRG